MAAIIPLVDIRLVSSLTFIEVNTQSYTYIPPIRKTSERPSFWLLETLRSQTTGSGSTSITRSVATFGTLMPCQYRAALMQLERKRSGSHLAEKGRQDAKEVMIPAIAVALTIPATT